MRAVLPGMLPQPVGAGALKLTPAELKLAEGILAGLTLKEAAASAGYGTLTAAKRALGRPDVRAFLDRARQARGAAAQLDPLRVLGELQRISLADLRQLFDEHGRLRPIHEWSDEAAASVASVEVVRTRSDATGQPMPVVKIRLWDKVRAIELLMQHLGLLQQQVQHQGEITFRWEGGEMPGRGAATPKVIGHGKTRGALPDQINQVPPDQMNQVPTPPPQPEPQPEPQPPWTVGAFDPDQLPDEDPASAEDLPDVDTGSPARRTRLPVTWAIE